MYSAVLMLALTAGSESVDFGRNRCHSCTATTACCGPVVTGCTAGACHGRVHGCSPVVVAPVCSSSCHSSCHHGGLFSKLRERRCHGCTTTCTVYTTCSTPVIVEPIKKKEMPKSEPLPDPKKDKDKKTAAPATIVVSLPAGARLTVDGAPTNSTSENRTLVTPNLEFGSTYVYTMRAEIVRDGQAVVQVQTVNVRGGETSVVQFDFPAQVVASR
jgi:uncharacterized protein (TIGR03000 family)